MRYIYIYICVLLINLIWNTARDPILDFFF